MVVHRRLTAAGLSKTGPLLSVSAIRLFGIEHQKPGTADTATAYIYQPFNCLEYFSRFGH
jgi:hypothetical protein